MSYNDNFNINIPNSSYQNSNNNNPTSLDTSNMNNLQNITPNGIKTEQSIGLDSTNQLDKSMVDTLQLTQDSITSQMNTASNTSSLPSQNNRPATMISANSTVPSFQSNKPPSNEFVRKLFNILEKNAYPEIVRWTDNGESFVVIDTGKFTSQILPNHFKHSNFASFVRQLNKYDFHKVKRKQDEKPKYGDLSWEFKHPSFRIHFDAGLDNIKRKITVSKKDADATVNGSNITNTNNNNGGMTGHILSTKTKENLLQNMVSKESFNNLKNKVNRLENELKSSKEEVSNIKIENDRMNTRYTTLLESLITFKTVHESLTNNFNSVCSILVNRGIEIPQNLYNNMVNQKSPTYNLQNENGLNNAISDSSSGSPIQNMHQHTLMNSLDSQIPMMNTPTNNDLLMSLPSSQKNRIQSPDNNTNSSNGSASINPMNNNDPNNSNGNKNANMNEPSSNNNNIPTDPNEITLRKGFHVLLVEDDAVSIQLCSRFLRKYGCTVEVVTDGLSAISTLEKFRYDLVLMDIVMPNLDGATATSIVRSFDNHTPIIAMTGNIEDQDLLTYLQHGMNDILAKPFTRNDLHSMLIRYLKDRVPLCEQKQNPANNNNTQLTPNMIRNSPNITSASQMQQNTSISPTLPTSMLQQSQQMTPPISSALQPPASIDSNPTSQMMSQTQSQPNSRNSSTFDGNEPASKKQRV